MQREPAPSPLCAAPAYSAAGAKPGERGLLCAGKSEQLRQSPLCDSPIQLRLVAAPCDQPPLISHPLSSREARHPRNPAPAPRCASLRKAFQRMAGIPPQSTAARGEGRGGNGRQVSCSCSARSILWQGQTYPLPGKAASESLPCVLPAIPTAYATSPAAASLAFWTTDLASQWSRASCEASCEDRAGAGGGDEGGGRQKMGRLKSILPHELPSCFSHALNPTLAPSAP